jgi:hypothetical protein
MPLMAKRRHEMHGFASKAQWRFFFAKARTDPRFAKWAREEAHETMAMRGGVKVAFRSLPWRTRGPSTTTLRKAA